MADCDDNYVIVSGRGDIIKYFIRKVPSGKLEDIVYTPDTNNALIFFTKEEADNCVKNYIMPLNHDVTVMTIGEIDD